MGVSAMGDRIEPAFDQLIRQRFGIGDHLLDMGFELGP